MNSRQRRSQRRLQEFLQRKNTGSSEERLFSPSCLQQDDFDSSKRALQNPRANLSSGEHDLDLKDIPPAQLTTQGGSRPPRADTFAAKGSRATSLSVPTSCSIGLVGSSRPSSPPQAHAAAETFQRSKDSTAPYEVQRKHGHGITNLAHECAKDITDALESTIGELSSEIVSALRKEKSRKEPPRKSTIDFHEQIKSSRSTRLRTRSKIS